MQEPMIGRVVELIHHRELIRNLIVRDLKVRYKNSALGILWSLLNPLLMTLVFTVVFTLMLDSGIPKYPVFFMCGFLPWSFLSASLISATNSIVGNAHLVKKVYFPREILPIADVMSNLVNFLLALLVLFALMLFFRIKLTPAILMLPLVILVQTVFTMGLAFFLATANVFYRDTAHILQVLMQAWFFLTPIFYPIEILPQSANVLGMTVNINCGQAIEPHGFADRLLPGCALPQCTHRYGFLPEDPGHLHRSFVVGYWSSAASVTFWRGGVSPRDSRGAVYPSSLMDSKDLPAHTNLERTMQKASKSWSSAWMACPWTSSSAGAKRAPPPTTLMDGGGRATAIYRATDLRSVLVFVRHRDEPGKTGIYDFLYRGGTYHFPR